MKKTIKEKYGVNEIELNNNSTSLEKWFNEVIYKSEIELNISDLLRMIRQNLFIDLALILSINKFCLIIRSKSEILSSISDL